MTTLPPIAIVGMRFRPSFPDGTSMPAWVAAYGEGRELLLESEPTNPYDPNAIKVIDPEGPDGSPVFVGYIPRGMAGLITAGLASGQTIESCKSLGGALVEIEMAEAAAASQDEGDTL